MVVWGAKDQGRAQGPVQGRPKLRREPTVPVRDDGVGQAHVRNTEPMKLRAAASAVDDLNVGTSHTRPVSKSMCTCMKS